MTPNEFRELALSFPEAIESAHMHHPDFRVGGKIFATLGYPNENSAMVKLSPDEQKEFVRSSSGVFTTAKGAWGRQGSYNCSLAGGNDRHRAQSARGSMAQHRAEAAIEKSSTQAHSFANAVHHLIGNFVGAPRTAGEDIVDIRFVLENFFTALAHRCEILPEFF